MKKLRSQGTPLERHSNGVFVQGYPRSQHLAALKHRTRGGNSLQRERRNSKAAFKASLERGQLENDFSRCLSNLELWPEKGMKRLEAEQGTGVTQTPGHAAEKEKWPRGRRVRPGEGDFQLQ